MATPLRSLPVVQNWDCHSCGDCCRELEAVITEEEKQRIEALDLANDPEVGAGPWFERRGWRSKEWTLKHRPEGGCVFLTAGNRCRLQERFGAEVKPFVCRLFPFLLIPAGGHWRVGMRFSCPSAVENKGRRVADQEADLSALAQLLEKHLGRSAESASPPYLHGDQQVPWPDLVRIVSVLLKIVEDRSDRLERRLRKCLALAKVCRQAQFDKVQGGRLSEFLHVMLTTVESDVPMDPAELPRPAWIGRVLFRTLLAIFARKDRGRHQGPAVRSRLARLRAGWRFVRGKGAVPRVNDFLPDTTFAEVESRTALPAEIDEILERYYVVKLNSLQFCGPPNFGLPFWAGLESLIFTLPVILWLTRAFAHLPPPEAVQKAILLVDNHFGGNPLLGSRTNRFFVRTLAGRGELERLVAWYGR